MKKIILFILTVFMATALAACDSKKDEEVGMPNPVKEYQSLEEINSKSGIAIVSPAVMGKTNEKFFCIDDGQMSEYQFEVNSDKYTIRASKTTDADISGLYYDGNTFEENTNSIFINELYKMARFFTNEGQYVFTIADEGRLDDSLFRNIAKEIANINGGEFYDGTYADTVSQRATMTVINNVGTYDIEVMWASSATESTVWTMHAKKIDNKLQYQGEEIATYTYDDEGNATVEQTASNNLGYFEIQDGKLLWSGAARDNCKTCIFELMNY